MLFVCLLVVLFVCLLVVLVCVVLLVCLVVVLFCFVYWLFCLFSYLLFGCLLVKTKIVTIKQRNNERKTSKRTHEAQPQEVTKEACNEAVVLKGGMNTKVLNEGIDQPTNKQTKQTKTRHSSACQLRR